jgi:ATP-binding cassette subfamily C protein CydC
VVELLLRLRPYEGSIAIGGAEVRDLSEDALPGLVAVLPQRPHLFDASIGENILVSRPDASPQELASAIAAAGLGDWVAALPDGLATRVGATGCRVSGGEGRRIALARALLSPAPILVLDEPTEGLDAATEQEVVAALAERTRGRTLLVVTHRPACLALVDRVVDLAGPTD